jgi:hypothetical protein
MLYDVSLLLPLSLSLLSLCSRLPVGSQMLIASRLGQTCVPLSVLHTVHCVLHTAWTFSGDNNGALGLLL